MERRERVKTKRARESIMDCEKWVRIAYSNAPSMARPALLPHPPIKIIS